MGHGRRAGAAPPSEEERVARPVRIDICGPLTVTVRGEARGREIRRQGRLVLAFLALERPRAVGRDELAQAVWGEEAGRSMRPGLSSVLSRLRRTLGDGAIESRGPAWVRLADDVDVDYHDAVGWLEAAQRDLRASRLESAACGGAARGGGPRPRARHGRQRALARGPAAAPSPTSPCAGANAWWEWPCAAAAPTSRRRSTTRARSSARSPTANRRTRC